MNLIVEQLQNDHRQLVRVLYHLEREVLALSSLGKDRLSLEKILDILDYIQVYPEIWHHPTEDLICEILLQKSIPAPGQLADCMEEHGVLELLTENLHAYIDQLAAGKLDLRLRFIKAANSYINRQLTHMEQEQKILFPLIENYLDQQDWAVIKERIKTRRPLEDDGRLQQYRNLYRGIASSSAITAH